jgi:hypothetical protein
MPAVLWWKMGLIKGFIVGIAILFVKDRLRKILKPDIEPLTTVDEFFLLDWDKNRANILTMMKTDRVEDPQAFMKFIDFRVRKLAQTH